MDIHSLWHAYENSTFAERLLYRWQASRLEDASSGCNPDDVMFNICEEGQGGAGYWAVKAHCVTWEPIRWLSGHSLNQSKSKCMFPILTSGLCCYGDIVWPLLAFYRSWLRLRNRLVIIICVLLIKSFTYLTLIMIDALLCHTSRVVCAPRVSLHFHPWSFWFLESSPCQFLLWPRSFWTATNRQWWMTDKQDETVTAEAHLCVGTFLSLHGLWQVKQPRILIFFS